MTDPKSSLARSVWLGLHLEQAGLRWLYLLVATPALTGVIETGRLPGLPREWVTELIVETMR